MPRVDTIRKDMHQGWKELHKYWKLDLEEKVKYAHKMLSTVFKRHRHPVVCWSGGKDSTVVLYLVRLHEPDIPVIYIDSGVEFPETCEFVNFLANEWNLNISSARPKAGERFWDIGSKYGWPIFGKSIAANVRGAIRSGKIRPQMSLSEKILAKNKIHISARCCEFIQQKPTKEIERLLQADLKVIGLRASESRARAKLWIDYGDYYFVKRYFGRGRGIWKANPIAIWTEVDIWKYHEIHSIPHCKLYDMGYTRNGCWSCAMGIRNGQLKRLRENHPELFKYLITQTEMGKELLKAKLVLMEVKGKIFRKRQDLNLLIEMHPDFFDRI